MPSSGGGGGSYARTSALISASADFRLLPPRLSICSSNASAAVLLCAALVRAAICIDFLDLLCLPIPSCNMTSGSSSCVWLFPFVSARQFYPLGDFLLLWWLRGHRRDSWWEWGAPTNGLGVSPTTTSDSTHGRSS
jgi:hypothetical protein